MKIAYLSNLPSNTWRTIDRMVDDSEIEIHAFEARFDCTKIDFSISSFYLAHWDMPAKIRFKDTIYEITTIITSEFESYKERYRFLAEVKIIKKIVDNANNDDNIAIQQEETSMNYSTAVLLINDKVQLVKVSYELNSDGKPASTSVFKTFESLEVGDFVVVPTDTRHNMTVCRVEEIDVDVDDYIDYHAELKWVISKVDNVSYNECLKLEQDAIKTIKSAEKRRKREELRKNVLADLEEKDLVALPIYSQQGE